MRDKKGKFQNIKEACAATGVKISAPGMELAIAGMPLRSCASTEADKAVNDLKQEVQEEVKEVVVECDQCVGVMIKSDTIGGLEALRNLLLAKQIPVTSASLGDITKKDLSKLESQTEKDPFTGVILGFNVKIPTELEEYIKTKKLKIFTNEVIYKTIEDYEAFTQNLKKEIEIRELSNLVRPCKFVVMKGYIFRQNNPAIVGVEVEIGQIKSGDPFMNMEGKNISKVKSMQESQENVSLATQGKQVAMAMDGVTIGRQVNEGDFLYSDIPEEDFKKMKELKKHLSKNEIAVLHEIIEIKRKNNPVWGVG
jgi:translation initiation factor 5B